MRITKRNFDGLVLRALVTTVVFTSAFFVAPPVPAEAAGAVTWGSNGIRAGAATAVTEVPGQQTLGSFKYANPTSKPLAQLSNGDYVFAWTDPDALQLRAQRVNSSGVPQWGSNGVLVYTIASSAYVEGIVADDSGNAIIVYQIGGSTDIYAQKLNASGVTQWTTGGMPVANVAGSAEATPIAVSDGQGGIIVAYRRGSLGSYDIYAQRLNGSGAKQWIGTGTPIVTSTNNQHSPVVVTSGTSSAIIGWTDLRGGSTNDIYAQKVSSAGTVQWTTNGTAISTASSNQTLSSAIADGSDGAVFVWYDGRAGTPGVYAQRINSSGTVQWTAGGTDVYTGSSSASSNPRLAMSATNTMVAYTRMDTDQDLYIQKLNSTGTKMFGDGIEIGSGANSEQATSVVQAGDGSTDVIVTWQTSTSSSVAKAQRISANGDVEWSAGGVSIASGNELNAASPTSNPYTITNSSGDLVFVAETADYTLPDILVQRLSATDGSGQWNSGAGLRLPNGPTGIDAVQDSPDVSYSGGFAFVAWRDLRADANGDVYVQKYSAAGAAQWTSGGVAVNTSSNNVQQNDIEVVADGTGGAYVLWFDSTDGKLKVTRLATGGGFASGWSSNGVEISGVNSGPARPQAGLDSAGGLIVAFRVDIGGAVNRVTSGGSVLWNATGTVVTDPASTATLYGMSLDGADGVFLIYSDGNVGGIRVTRRNPDGNLWAGWGPYGKDLNTTNTGSDGQITTDASGGVVAAWHDGSSTSEIRVQRLNGGGDALWTAGGVLLATDDSGDIGYPDVVNSGSGSGIVAWYLNNGVDNDIRAQKLNSSGATQWDASGITVAGKSGDDGTNDSTVVMDSDGSNGAVLAWKGSGTSGNANGNIYANRVTSDGSLRWGDNGLTLAARGPGDLAEHTPDAVGDGSGGIVAAFIQAGSPEQISIQYAQDTPLSGAGSGSADSTSTITNVRSDVMTRLKISTPSDHTIRQTLPPTANFDATTSTDMLAYDFPSGFGLSGTWVAGDFEFNDGTVRTVNAVAQGAGTTTVSCTDATNNVGVAIDTTAKVFRVRPCGSSYASSTSTTTVTFRIFGTSGDGILTNPSSAGINEIVLSMDDEGSADAFLTDISVYIMDDDQVTVTADVNATLAFDIDIQTTCGSESAAPYTVSLGALTTASVATAASKICLDLDTNAAGGARVTVQGSGAVDGLESAGSGDSIGTAYGASPVALAAGTEGYGLCVESTSAVTGSATASAPYNGGCGSDLVGGVDSAAPQAILTTGNAPIDGTTNNTAAIRLKAAISAATAAGNDYTDILTFIATGTY